MFKLSYDTTPCRDYVTQPIANAIRKEMTLGGKGLNRPHKPHSDQVMWDTFELIPGPADIKPFGHPLMLDGSGDQRPEFVVDVRNFCRTKPDGDKVVTATLDYETAILRLMLEKYWYENDTADLLSLGTFQVTVFARWIAEVITRRLALPPEVQLRLTIIAAYFYLCMFRGEDDGESLKEQEMMKVATMIARSINTNATEVIKVIEGFKRHKEAQDFVDELIANGGSERFESFNLALLYSIISGSWFGFNAKEMLRVAFEFPPTFIALVALAANERGFKDTHIGKIVRDYDRNDTAKSFLYNLGHLPVR
jgi:hypothetical protein